MNKYVVSYVINSKDYTFESVIHYSNFRVIYNTVLKATINLAFVYRTDVTGTIIKDNKLLCTVKVIKETQSHYNIYVNNVYHKSVDFLTV